MPELLVPISPGELIDKITILEIKSARMTDAAKLHNVRTELTLLNETWQASAFSRQADITRSALGRPGMSTTEHRLEQAERLSSLSYQQILSTKVAFGTATALIDRFKTLEEELGINGVVAELNAGGLNPLERAQRTLQILTHEVMPAFK